MKLGQNNQIQELVAAGIEKLKEAGFKSTKKRQEIIELFAENQRYLNAAFIHQEMNVWSDMTVVENYLSQLWINTFVRRVSDATSYH